MDELHVARVHRRERDLRPQPLQDLDFVEAERRLLRPARLELPAGMEDLLEALLGDVVAVHAQEESIVERFQGVVLGGVVARADEHERRERPRLAAPPEHPLVERHEEAVEDGAVRVQELVEKDERRLGQHPLGVRDELALAELPDVERPEELARLGEPREEIVEGAAAEPRAEIVHERALRRSRGAEKE